MKKILLILCALLLTVVGASAQSSWTAPELPTSTLTNEGKYYLYNTEAGQFMGNAKLQWGSEAAFSETGFLATLAYDESNSAYTIYNNGINNYSGYVFRDGNYLYVDGSSSSDATNYARRFFTFTAVSDGTYTIQTAWTEDDYSGYLGYDAQGTTENEIKTTLTSSDTGIYWDLIAETDYELYIAKLDLYNVLVEAEELGMTADTNEAYKNAGEVYTSTTSTVAEIEAAIEALELAMDVDSDYHTGDEVTVNGTKYEILTDNAVVNHSFELGFEGWTDATSDHNTLTSANFDLYTSDAQHGDYYLVGTTNGGSSAAGSINNVWSMEAGKTYYFSYWVKGLNSSATNGYYLMTSVTNTIGDDYDVDNKKDSDGAHLLHNFDGGEDKIGTEWQKVEVVFTNGEEGADDYYQYLQIKFRWLNSQWGFDNFSLHEVEHSTEVVADDCDYEEGDVVNADGYTCTIKSGNMFVNGGFNNGVEGWTAGNTYTKALSSNDVTFTETGGYNDGQYLTLKSSVGAANEATPTQKIAVEAGKTYLFVGYTSGTAPTDANKRYSALFEMDLNEDGEIVEKSHDEDGTSYSNTIIQLEWGEDGWTKTEGVFTVPAASEEGTYSYVGMRMNWSTGSYDGFQLYEVEAVELEYVNDVTWALANPSFEVDNVVANLTIDTTRGTEAGGAWTVESLTGWDLVVPNNSYSFHDIMTKDATATDNGFGVPGEPTDGTYMLYLRDGNNTTTSSVEQTITLPAGEYKLTVDSKCVSTGGSTAVLVAGGKSTSLDIHSSYGSEEDALDWDTAELKFSLDATTDVTVGVDISYSSNGSFLLDNFKLYSVEEIEKAISWTMTDAGWGTMILPFAATLEEGLTAYSCDGTTTDEENETTTVDLTEVGQSINANTPYIIKCTDEDAVKAHSFTGTPINTVETYTDGILTGTLVDLAIEKGAALTIDGTNYVLQNHTEGDEPEGLAFYPITDESEGVELDAYHCYLDLSLVTTSARPVALHFPGSGEATAIVAVESETLTNDAIYDLSGRRVSKAVKGVYIQNGKKVLVK